MRIAGLGAGRWQISSVISQPQAIYSPKRTLFLPNLRVCRFNLQSGCQICPQSRLQVLSIRQIDCRERIVGYSCPIAALMKCPRHIGAGVYCGRRAMLSGPLRAAIMGLGNIMTLINRQPSMRKIVMHFVPRPPRTIRMNICRSPNWSRTRIITHHNLPGFRSCKLLRTGLKS